LLIYQCDFFAVCLGHDGVYGFRFDQQRQHEKHHAAEGGGEEAVVSGLLCSLQAEFGRFGRDKCAPLPRRPRLLPSSIPPSTPMAASTARVNSPSQRMIRKSTA
jgi:hypothetical protein